MNDDSVQEFFDHILRVADESDRRFQDADKKVAKYMLSRITYANSCLKNLRSSIKFNDQQSISADFEKKLTEIEPLVSQLKSTWEEKLHGIPVEPSFSRYSLSTIKTSNRGRPSYEIDLEYVRTLREYHFKWEQIAKILSIHRSTLWRKLKNSEIDFSPSFSEISKEVLNEQVSEIKKQNPLAGERMVIGFLQSIGLHIQRWKVRESIHTVDGGNCMRRWLMKNPRWIYSVPGPNSLWHNDGLHKLIHWGIVIHACMDGFSRMITSLHCATNNKAETALDGFLKGVKLYGVPATVRGDRGAENMGILKFMREKQGYEGAYIQGPSVHNQRIERLHYDTTHCVLSQFVNIFKYMEEWQCLERDNIVDLFALHFVFVPRIQRALDNFKEAWNHHQLSTEKNNSPYQLWLLGMMDDKKSGQKGVRTFLERDNQSQDFGIDMDSHLNCMPDDLTVVEVNSICFSQHDNDSILNTLNCEFSALDDDGNFGITTFELVKNRLLEQLQ